MAAWETLLAAIGGLVLGFGLGLVAGRRREQGRARDLARLRSRVRASVLPVLEGRAQALGVSRSERGYDTEDPLEAVVDLSSTIQRLEDAQNMAFSDTLELSRKELDRRRR